MTAGKTASNIGVSMIILKVLVLLAAIGIMVYVACSGEGCK